MKLDIIQKAQTLQIPDDLRQLTDERSLVCRVLEAIHACCPRYGDSPEDASSRQKVLRTLVLYCYASGLYSSRDLAFAAVQDPQAVYICAGFEPDWSEIRTFRRQNAPQLQQDLAEVLRSVVIIGDSAPCSPTSVRPPWMDARDIFLRNAESRLRRAIHEDSMAMDD
jgi:hypothetical protein